MIKRLLLFTFLTLCLTYSSAPAETNQTFSTEAVPSLIEAVRIAGPLDFCGEPVPLDSADVRERLEKEMLLILWDRPQVILWLKRSARYFPFIESTLAQNNMPDDLKYIAVVESSLLPHAGSSQGAVGYWQFMPQTGRNHGLTVDENIDQRRNFFASTRAAAAYLQDLHDLFGSWTLAAAAYNMGEDWLKDEKKHQKVDSYYEFYLPIETQRYIFKIIAVKLIFSDPARYGFHLRPQDYYAPEVFDRVKINLPGQTPLYLAARASASSFKQIKDLNPEIRGDYLPKGTIVIAVPKGAGAHFHERFADLAEQWRQENRTKIYIVKKGDSLSLIAARFKVPLPALMAWNNLHPDRFIHPGEKLVIYQ